MYTTVCYSPSLPNSMFSDITWVAWSWLWWEYLYCGNCQTLKICLALFVCLRADCQTSPSTPLPIHVGIPLASEQPLRLLCIARGLLSYCRVTNFPKIQWLKIINSYYCSWFLCVKWWRPLSWVVLACRVYYGHNQMCARAVTIWSAEVLSDLMLQDLLPKWLPHIGVRLVPMSMLWVSITRRPQFGHMGISRGCLSFLTTWWLATPRASSLSMRQTQKTQLFLRPSHANHHHHLCHMLMVI